MIIYAFDSTTGEYLDEVAALESPLEPGKYLLLNNTTVEAPPAATSGMARVWDGTQWALVEDCRGQTLWKKEDGTPVVIECLGPLADQVTPELTQEEPPAVPEGKKLVWDWECDKWALEDLPPPPPLEVVSMRQARLALHMAGKLDAVNQAIASMPGDKGEAARIEWEYAQEVRRGNPLTSAMVAHMGMDEEAVDELFGAAACL
ncbi:MAG: hypothetical protein FWF12_10250 [Betaproteobacteria bacterium]|nr:hypothetical protein [Betaproteobacteria bacterium]